MRNLLLLLLVTDLTLELGLVHESNPFWGRGQPRAWHTFMTFGLGRKCADSAAEASLWTLTGPARGQSRKRAGRESQRAATKSKRERLRAEADADHRAATAARDPMVLMHQNLLVSFNNFNAAFQRKQRISELSQLAQLGVPGAQQKLTEFLSTPLVLAPLPAPVAGSAGPGTAPGTAPAPAAADPTSPGAAPAAVVPAHDAAAPAPTPVPAAVAPAPDAVAPAPTPVPAAVAPAHDAAAPAPTPVPAAVAPAHTGGTLGLTGSRRRRSQVCSLSVFIYY